MESSTVRRVYRFRLEPTAAQEQSFRQFAGARRFIWNWALQQRREHYQQTGQSLSAKELSARLTALKDQPETAWLRDVDSQLLQQVRVVGRGVQVPKIGRVRLRLSQPVEGQTKSATFKQDACGHWHVSLVAETQMPVVLLPF